MITVIRNAYLKLIAVNLGLGDVEVDLEFLSLIPSTLLIVYCCKSCLITEHNLASLNLHYTSSLSSCDAFRQLSVEVASRDI